MNWKEFLAGVAAATSASESPTTLSDAQLLLFDVMDTVCDAAALLWLAVMKLLIFGYCNIRFSMREMDWRSAAALTVWQAWNASARRCFLRLPGRVRHSIAIYGQQRMCMREKAWLAASVSLRLARLHPCKQGTALASPTLHACGCARPSRACFGHKTVEAYHK